MSVATVRPLLLSLLAVSGVCTAASAEAQSSSTSGVSDDILLQGKTFDVGPFRLTAGPNTDGYLGASLKGDDRHIISALSSRVPTPDDLQRLAGKTDASHTIDIGYSTDGEWSSASNAQNSILLSLRPEANFLWAVVPQKFNPAAPPEDLIDACKKKYESKQSININDCMLVNAPSPIVAITAFGDLRYRDGMFKPSTSATSTPASSTPLQINQIFAGGGVELTKFILNSNYMYQWPTLSVAYYTVLHGTASAGSIPDNLKADVLEIATSTKLWIPLSCHCLRLYLDGTADKPTQGTSKAWEIAGTVQLVYDRGGTFKPAVTYKSGKQGGLSYDRQIILGALVDLLRR